MKPKFYTTFGHLKIVESDNLSVQNFKVFVRLVLRIGSYFKGMKSKFEDSKKSKLKSAERSKFLRTRGDVVTNQLENHSLRHYDQRTSFYEQPPDYKGIRRSEAKQFWLTSVSLCDLKNRGRVVGGRVSPKKFWITDII